MAFNWSPTIVSRDQRSDQLSSQIGYLDYAKGDGTGNQHYLYRRAFNIVAQ